MLHDGVFEFGEDVRVTPFMSEGDFKGLSPAIKRGPVHGDYRWYSVRHCTWNGRAINLSVCFHESQLHSLQFGRDHGADYSWDDWSEDSVREDKTQHDLWLAEFTGENPPYTYDWGAIESITDWKGGFSTISVSFCPR